MRAVLLVCLGCTSLVLTPTGVIADDKEKAEQLKKEIAALRAQVAAKEAELAKLQPAPTKPFVWEQDSVGTFPYEKGVRYIVLSIEDPGEVIVGCSKNGFAAGKPFHVKGIPTAGLSKRDTVDLSGTFKVTGEYILRGYGDFDGSTWSIRLQK